MPMPDTRGYLALAFVLMTVLIFSMIAINPKIADVQLFGVLATAIISGGLGAITGFYFGSAKSGEGKDAVIAAQLDKTQ